MNSLAKFSRGNGLREKQHKLSVRQISRCGVVLVLKSGSNNGVLARSKKGGGGRGVRQARGEREKRKNIDTELILALEVSSHKLPREGPK